MAKNKKDKASNHSRQMRRNEENKKNKRKKAMSHCPLANNCPKGWGCSPDCPRLKGKV